ncbi:MAG: Acyl-coenzyme A thioesterase PaaI, contains HGG motif [uncultured Thiotrichaceae bacterium]|uniref:Acyl-coenzyme A thioesterase PaaI, contains HGG motif n=1 Tax=uncultured Thiotrichaceae bacterium TaxID=298394 RepID=A0A6S6TK60_9GAMM|nr:MAG: Acyl-coenzyme A thioesterase PaaI, contains HGG motif [uncultured Thiotrichaceae bacterium]
MPTSAEITAFLEKEFPQTKCMVESVGEQSALVRHPIGFDELRPGGTVSGPALMAVADVGLYVAILGEIGMKPFVATTNLNINFLRMPTAEKDIMGDCKLIKVGRTLIVGEASLYSDGNPTKPVAHIVGTYYVDWEAKPNE